MIATSTGINAARALLGSQKRKGAGADGSGRRKNEVAVNILHRITFARRGGTLLGIGPVLVYGARILVPDTPAELYASVGALTLAHALGVNSESAERATKLTSSSELPADMALLFTGTTMSDVARGA